MGGDMSCEKATKNKGSYCKYWASDPKGRVCQGSTTPCHCGGCKGDKFCQAKVGPSSYCKYWAKGPGGKVCQYSNVPCNCKRDTPTDLISNPVIDAIAANHPITSGPSQCPRGDMFCEK